jgi:hypothetical protein
VNFRFIVNSSGLIAGFFVLPGEIAWQRPAYSKPDTFTVRLQGVGDLGERGFGEILLDVAGGSLQELGVTAGEHRVQRLAGRGCGILRLRGGNENN